METSIHSHSPALSGSARNAVILVVDDNSASLEIITGLLQENGYQAHGALDGDAALMAAIKQQPDLILLDIQMRGKDGFQVCAELQELPGCCNIPVIFLSGLENTTDKLRAFEAGGIDYITKSMHPTELLARIRAQLTLLQSRRELENRANERALALQANITYLGSHEEQQIALKDLLEITLMNGPLEETLQHCLQQILNISWLSILPKGAIFLSNEEEGRLNMIASANLSPGVLSACREIAYGQCLCGRAAARGSIMRAEHVDEMHSISYDGMEDHGHYCLPLKSKKQVVGVLNLYLPPGISPGADKEGFLASVADILTGYIFRKQGEQALVEYQVALEKIVRARTSDLKSSEARTRAIVTTMLDAVVHIDSRGTILTVNFATQDLFGYEESEMIGRNISLLMPEPHASAHDNYIARYLHTRQSQIIGRRTEVMARHKCGNLFPIELAVNELFDDDGSTFIGVMHDLTSQRAAEEQLKKALQTAQTATEAKSSFLANMSHEIRTPLNAVLGLSKIGMRDSQEHEITMLFERIHDSGAHLLGVVNDILDFSKLEAGKLKIENRPFALLAAINNVQNFVAMRAEEKGLAFSTSLAPDLSDWVMGDSLRLTQILTNLLSNAIKFTKEGEVMLRAARDGNDLVFMVADSGIGMSSEQLARLFQPFEQADNSTSRKFGGSGLGLAISRQLAQMMGGDIDVESRPDAGSSFFLRLPLPVVAAPANHSEPDAVSTAASLRLKGVTALVADDVDINRFIIEDILVHEGARAVLAKDGQDALALLDAEGASAFNIVLMDVQMPIMNGIEATRRILDIAPMLPVVGLTAHAMPEERDKCLAAGMVDHVTKPVDADILVRAIHKHVSMKARPVLPVTKPAATPHAPGNLSFTNCNDPDVIDLGILARRVRNDPVMVTKLTSRFLETTRPILAEMKSAMADEDMAALGSLSHRLKSSAFTVGAMRFGEFCKELEKLAADGDRQCSSIRVDQLHELFDRIVQQTSDALKA